MKKFLQTILIIFCLTFSLFSLSQWTQPTVTRNTGDDLQAVSFGDDNTVFAAGDVVLTENWLKKANGMPHLVFKFQILTLVCIALHYLLTIELYQEVLL